MSKAAFQDEEEARAAGLKPGQAYAGGWVSWKVEDLDPKDTVSFVPREIQGQRYQDVDGEKYLYLTVNGLMCVLHLNEINTINRFFYNAYLDNFNGAKALEEFKRKGPSPAMWDQGGPLGGNTWYYEGEAHGGWMDQDGKYLRSDEHYSITEPGLEGMPISLGKDKDLIEAGTHPEYRRPPQIISYSIGLHVLWRALNYTEGRLVKKLNSLLKWRP